MTEPTAAPALRRLLLVSDHVHPFIYRQGFPQGLPPIDAVLAAGDLPGDYLEFLASTLPVPVVYVHGNHANEDVTEGERRIPPRGVLAAHGRVVTVAGLRIGGWGGVPRYRAGGSGQYSPAQARWGLRRLSWQAGAWAGRPPLDLLLTHAPPLGPHAGEDFAHRGCPQLMHFMARYRPRVLVHGHIHEYEGRKSDYTDERAGTWVVNAYGYRIIEVQSIAQPGGPPGTRPANVAGQG